MSTQINNQTEQKDLVCIVQLYADEVVSIVEREEFSSRLAALRMNKGVSARDMSLSIGQSAGYINNIENGVNYPAMTTFFYICDYLGVTPKEFFDVEETNPQKVNELLDAAKHLNSEQLDHLIALAKGLSK